MLIFREDFETQSGFTARWVNIAGASVVAGQLNLDASSGGTARRRENIVSDIVSAYIEVSQVVPTGVTVDYFLSRNGRHYTRATWDGSTIWSVSVFKETDGTADFLDSSQTATNVKVLGVLVVSSEGGASSAALGISSFALSEGAMSE